MSKPIEGCPQPETEIRERAWTAEQVERAAEDWETFGATDSPAMLRAYATTLRQQAERPMHTVASVRAELVAKIGDCCMGGDPLCAGGCLAEKAAAKNAASELAALAQNAQGHGDAVAFLVTDAKGKKFTVYNALLAEAIRKIAKDKGSSLQVDAVCTIPDYGWFCTRGEGHDGPCAAWPNSPTETCPTCGGPATRREVSGAFEMRNEWSHAESARVPDSDRIDWMEVNARSVSFGKAPQQGYWVHVQGVGYSHNESLRGAIDSVREAQAALDAAPSHPEDAA